MITITVPTWLVITFIVFTAIKWAVEIYLEYRKANLKHELDKLTSKPIPPQD